MKSPIWKFILPLLAVVLGLPSCSTMEPGEAAQWIEAYTPGRITSDTPIRIKFAEAVGDRADSAELAAGVLKFSPHVKGRAHWQEEEKKQTELTRFGGKLLNGLSLSGKLQSQGWYRGSVQDAGGYYDFYREDGNVGVDLEFSGSFVGDENDEVTVYGAKFYQARTVERGSYVYDRVKEENQYALCEVSPRYFSEIVLQLTKATASSQEQLPYPECKKNQ